MKTNSKLKKAKKVVTRFRVKVGDKVKVIAGGYRGHIGVVKSCLRDVGAVLVEGCLFKKTVKAGEGSGFKTMESAIHVSNVKKL